MASGVIYLLAKCFQYFLEFILEIICLALFIASLAAVWRWPWIFEFRIRDRWGRRAMCVVNFGCMLLDYFSLAIFFATLGTWRGPLLLGILCAERGDFFRGYGWEERFYAVGLRLSVLEQFGRFLIDIPFLLMSVFTIVATPWRNFWFWPRMYKEAKENGIPFFFCCSSSNSKYHDKYDTEYRHLIFEEFVNSIVDILMLPILLVIAISGYRIPLAIEAVKAEENFIEKKLRLLQQGLLVFMDLPFMLMGLITLLFGFRARLFLKEFGEEITAAPRRKICGYHFLCTFRDLLCIPLFLATLVSIYRGFFAVTQMLTAVAPWADDRPQLNVTTATLMAPERGTGLQVRVQGTKKASFVLKAGQDVCLYIRNGETFWPSVGDVFGATVASVGPTMLPMKLNPRYLNPTVAVCEGETDVDFVIDFNTHYPTDTIRKNCKKLLSTPCLIQIEYGKHEGTLFNAKLASVSNVPELISSGDSIQLVDSLGASAEEMAGQWLCDVFWKIAAIQFGLLLLDIIGLVFLVLLHLFPHRAYRVYSTGCEGSERKALRKVNKAMQEVRRILCTTGTILKKCMQEAEESIRPRISSSDDGYSSSESVGWRHRSRLRRHSKYYSYSPSYEPSSEFFQHENKITAAKEVLLKYTHTGSGSGGSKNDPQQPQDKDGGGSQLLHEEEEGKSSTLVLDVLLQVMKEGLKLHRDAVCAVAPHSSLPPRLYDGVLGPMAVPPNAENNKNGSSAPDAEVAVEDLEARQVQQAIMLSINPMYNPDSGEFRQEYTYDEEGYIVDLPRQEQQQPEAEAVVVASSEPSVKDKTLLTIMQSLPSSKPRVASGQEEGQSTEDAAAKAAVLQHLRDIPSITAEIDKRVKLLAPMVDELADEAQHNYDGSAWCKGKEGWGGLRSVIYTEVGQLMFDFVALLCFLIVFFSLYRTYPLLWDMWHYPTERRKLCLRNFAEIFIDIFYLFKFCLVLIGIRGIFTMPVDLVFFLMQRPRFHIARQIIDYHLNLFFVDLLYLISMVFAWDAIRAAAATLLFGLFAPGVMLESAFVDWDESDTQSYRRPASKNLFRAGCLLFWSMAWMLALPFILGYPVAKANAVAVRIVFFVILGLILWGSMIFAMVKGGRSIRLVHRSVIRYLRPALHNTFVFVGLLTEVVFVLAMTVAPGTEELYGNGAVAEAVSNASQFVFLVFGQSWTGNGIPLGVYVSFGITFVHFVLSAAPVVMGDMLHWRKTERLLRSPIWYTAVQLTGFTLLPIVVRNFTSLLMCDEYGGPMLYASGAECWMGHHRGLGVAAMVALIYYVPSCLMRNAKYNEALCLALDIIYPQLYRLIINVAFASALVCTVLAHHSPVAVAILCLINTLWCGGWTLLYPKIFNPEEKTMCSVRSLQGWRLAVHGCGFIAALVALVAAAVKPGHPWPLYVMAGGLVVGCLAAFGFSVYLGHFRTPEDDSVEQIRDQLLLLENQLHTAGQLHRDWDMRGASWRFDVRHATRASVLALKLQTLENFTSILVLTPVFLRARQAWATKTDRLVSRQDREREIDLDYELPDTSVMDLIICCDWGCCSHYRDRWGYDDLSLPDESQQLIELGETVTAFENAVGVGLRRIKDAAGASQDYGAAPGPPPGAAAVNLFSAQTSSYSSPEVVVVPVGEPFASPPMS